MAQVSKWRIMRRRRWKIGFDRPLGGCLAGSPTGMKEWQITRKRLGSKNEKSIGN